MYISSVCAQMAETTRTMTKALQTGPMAMASDDTMSRSDPIRPKSRTTRKARIELLRTRTWST